MVISGVPFPLHQFEGEPGPLISRGLGASPGEQVQPYQVSRVGDHAPSGRARNHVPHRLGVANRQGLSCGKAVRRSGELGRAGANQGPDAPFVRAPEE
jgi:hypothetical protein